MNKAGSTCLRMQTSVVGSCRWSFGLKHAMLFVSDQSEDVQ
jgi:hypothetical protein